MSNGTLPSYLSMAKPNPPSNRAPWYKNTAPTYAGIMLWFVFWQDVPTGAGALGGTLSHGLGTALSVWWWPHYSATSSTIWFLPCSA